MFSIPERSKMNAAREKKHTVTTHDDAIAAKLTVKLTTTYRNLMRNKL